MRKLVSLILSLSFVATSQAATITGKVSVAYARDHRDVVVYISKLEGKTFPPPADPVILDQIYISFKPHVLPILAGTRVVFPNSDDIRHSVVSPTRVDGKKLDFGQYPRGSSKEWVFAKPGIITLLCNIHLEMSAYIFVMETPYVAVTDSQGSFTIPNVPPGSYTINAWHEMNVRNSKRGLQSKKIEVTATGATVDFELR